MKSTFCLNYIHKEQNELYSHIHSSAKSYPNLIRLGAVPLAILDVGIELTGHALSVFECLILTVAHVVGSIFSGFTSSSWSLKESLAFAELTTLYSTSACLKVVLAAFRILYQTVVIIIDPTHVLPISSKRTFAPPSD